MTRSARRVVITGVGVICPLGSTKESLWEALSEGRSGVGPLSIGSAEAMPAQIHRGLSQFSFDENGTVPLGLSIAAEAGQFSGEIDDFGPLEKEIKKTIRKALKVQCRECQMGIAVAQLALSDARLKTSEVAPERCGISFGADYMLSAPEEFSEGIKQCLDDQGRFDFSRWGKEGMPKMSPLWLLKYLPNMPASHLAIYNDFRGPNNSITLREAAANAALGEAFQIILRGSAEVMLVGATGTRLHSMKLIHAMGQEEVAVDGDPATASRPFDRDRRGMVLGEGAGAVVLEELENAKARGATIYGEVVSAATSCVAGRHLIAQRDRAMVNVLQSVLNAAGANLNDIGHLNAHGLSTRTCDVEEARAIGEVFSSRSTPLPVVAAKSNFGNLGAGSGMVELIASLLAMQHDRLFPMLNYATPDPECPVSAVRNGDVRPGSSFINLSVTPQGQASAAMVKKYEEQCQHGSGIVRDTMKASSPSRFQDSKLARDPLAELRAPMESKMLPSSLPDFLASLETVPWFSRLGASLSESAVNPRIGNWDEWSGPEDDDVMELNMRQQSLYDEIMGQGDPPESLKNIWNQIHESVFRRATSTVPYDPAQDAWHGPSAAVWQAAWTAGLVGLCLAKGRSIPQDLESQWLWFLRGHWPCGYESVSEDGQPGPLVVY